MNKNLKTLFFKISDLTSKLNTLIPKKRNRIVILPWIILFFNFKILLLFFW